MDHQINYPISQTSLPIYSTYSPFASQLELWNNSSGTYSPISFFFKNQMESFIVPFFPYCQSPQTYAVGSLNSLHRRNSISENDFGFCLHQTPVQDSLNNQGSARMDQYANRLIKETISKNKNVDIKVKKNTKDKQYLPNRKEKHQRKRKIYDNQNRNIIPNEINQIISFIQKRNKSGHLMEKIFQKEKSSNQSYNIGRFYLYQSQLKEKIGHYTNVESMKLINQLYEPTCMIWDQDEQRYYNKLCRLLIHHFLLEDSIFNILTSKRMKSLKKIDHLRARRVIAKKVLQILREG